MQQGATKICRIPSVLLVPILRLCVYPNQYNNDNISSNLIKIWANLFLWDIRYVENCWTMVKKLVIFTSREDYSQSIQFATCLYLLWPHIGLKDFF